MINPFIPRLLDKRQRRIQKLLETFYPTPNPFESLEQFYCYANKDILNLTIYELKLECRRAERRLESDPKPSAWLIARLSTIRKMLK